MSLPDLSSVKVTRVDAQGARLEVPWSVWVGFFVGLAAAVGGVWLSTQEVTYEVRTLSSSIDGLTQVVAKLEQKIDDGERERASLRERVSVLEARIGERG